MNLTKPTEDEIKDEQKDDKIENKKEIGKPEASSPASTHATILHSDEPGEQSLLDKINSLQDGDIDGLLSLYPEAARGQGEELGKIEEKFDNYLLGIKNDKEKLEALQEKVKDYPNLKQKVDAALIALEDNNTKVTNQKQDNQTISDVVKSNFLKLSPKLSDQEILTLSQFGKVELIGNINCFKLNDKLCIEKLSPAALDILQDDDKNINVAFANNPAASIDSWIIGKPKDVEETDGVKSYTIDCEGVGKFGLEFKVTQTSKDSNEYTVVCTSTVNTSSTYENLYAAKGGRKYELGDDGVLHYADNRGPVVSTTLKTGYSRILREDEEQS